jgi:NTP pyrophosphatase (non-canonical NTP hydrolase)
MSTSLDKALDKLVQAAIWHEGEIGESDLTRARRNVIAEIMKMLTLNNYQKLAMRTAFEIPDKNTELTYSALAIVGEAGELADLIKKVVFHGKPMNPANHHKMVLEAGDVLWGLARLAKALGTTLEEIGTLNIAKLKERYPDGYSEERANNHPPDPEWSAQKVREQVKSEPLMPLDDAIYAMIHQRNAGYEIQNGIVTVREADGSVWDFTEPKKKRCKHHWNDRSAPLEDQVCTVCGEKRLEDVEE